MPPVSQFPPARVFLKTPSGIQINGAANAADCDAACDWYNKVFGFTRIRNDSIRDRAMGPSQPMFKIYPSTLQRVKVAWLSCGNSVGFEVFEFVDPPHEPAPQFEFARSGFFHICVTAPDVEEAVERAVKEGGKLVGETTALGPKEKAAYVSDPWGNVVEVLSCSFESLMANKE
ncbi:hypothetical protein N0V90_010777 [Kalmusia sp. IMI 367209]|nr:hypothetical protein N0V90_010777 [Kalmusia sp. IMI 367209]